MWWPFGRGDKDTKELEKELPSELLLFFEEVNPEAHKSERSPKDKVVQAILSRNQGEYSHKLASYKRNYLLDKVTGINCAEVQQVVVDCYKGWLYISTDRCAEEMKRTSNCLDIQNKALRQLRYEDCYNEAQCQQIRTVVDILFTKNFGKLGDHVNEGTERKFEQDVERMFDKLWK